jgi:OTU domain-containing protein 6
MEDLETAHKKALKTLEGEKRAAIKKAKALKGKKGKEALASLETEFADKLKALEAKYQEDVAALAVGSATISEENGDENNKNAKVESALTTTHTAESTTGPAAVDPEEEARQRKLAKARKKREKQKEKEAAVEKQIEEETANAGPSMRDVELGQLQTILSPLHLSVQEVQADGHCLYRAVGAQINQPFQHVRKYFGMMWTCLAFMTSLMRKEGLSYIALITFASPHRAHF